MLSPSLVSVSSRQRVPDDGIALAEFLHRSAAQPIEIIAGEIVEKMPTILLNSVLIRTLFIALHQFVSARRLGEVFQETTFIQVDSARADWVRGSLIPDLMLIAADRFAAYVAATPDYAARPLAIVPDLAIEVLSPSDSFADVMAKVELYLSLGVHRVWIVDAAARKVLVYAPGQPTRYLSAGELLTGDDPIEGFTLPINELFPLP